MSQSALEIWTVALLIWSVVLSICTITFVREWKKRARNYDVRMKKLSDYENTITEREENLDVRDAAFVPFYAKVTYSQEDIDALGVSLKAVTRKKLAQRLGYRILERFNGSIHEADAYPPKVKAYQLDVLVGIDTNARKQQQVQKES